jgi:hypothetical protein
LISTLILSSLIWFRSRRVASCMLRSQDPLGKILHAHRIGGGVAADIVVKRKLSAPTVAGHYFDWDIPVLCQWSNTSQFRQNCTLHHIIYSYSVSSRNKLESY